MESTNLLPILRELPEGDSTSRRDSCRDMVKDLIVTDPPFFAAEFTVATYAGLWSIFDDVNVDDRLSEAYRMAYPGLADDHSLHEHWRMMQDRGPESADGFMSGLKGKFAEILHSERLEEQGFTNVEIASDPTQSIWDISATSPDGNPVLIQVKTGMGEYASHVQERMGDSLNVDFAVSSEIFQRLSEQSGGPLDRVTDIGPDLNLIDGIQDGLDTLSSNMGIDVPDGLADAIPYATAIIAGARLVYGVLQTERQFSAADRTTRNKIQVIQAMTLMSRVGVSSTLAMAGGAGGMFVGSAIPFVGNLAGGLVGSIAGAGMGTYLNKHLKPHMLNLALDITGLTSDDLFYYKNKVRVDGMAWRYRQTAAELNMQGEI